MERLTETLCRARAESAGEICRILLDDVDRFSDSDNTDDQTPVVFKALKPLSPRLQLLSRSSSANTSLADE